MFSLTGGWADCWALASSAKPMLNQITKMFRSTTAF
jgi:hypothetical protein